MIIQRGDRFEGTFKQGWKVRGKLFEAKGNLYDGDFENDLKHGSGTYKMASGNVSTGDFKVRNFH